MCGALIASKLCSREGPAQSCKIGEIACTSIKTGTLASITHYTRAYTLNRLDHLQLMATYNQWMNEKLCVAAATLDAEALSADRKAFFGSILGTLNHLLVGDIIWLKRFAQHPAGFAALDIIRGLRDPQSLNEQVFNSLAGLAEQRKQVDQAIIEWTAELQEDDLDVVLHYTNTAGIAAARDFYGLLIHFFNHQTHHRGQATTLLTQAGVDVGSTDFLGLIANA